MVNKTRMWIDLALVVGLFIFIGYVMSAGGTTFSPSSLFHKNVDTCIVNQNTLDCSSNTNGKTLCNHLGWVATAGKCISPQECNSYYTPNSGIMANGNVCFQGV